MRRIDNLRHGSALILLAVLALPALPGRGQIAYDDLAPRLEVDCPVVSGGSAVSVNMPLVARFTGEAPASPGGRPAKYRYLLKPALAPDGTTITSAYHFHQVPIDTLIGWGDAAWSPWLAYPTAAGPVELEFADLTANTYYFLALQVMDHTGAVSLGRRYQVEVAHVVARQNVFQPAVTIYEQFLPASAASSVSQTLAAGMALNFWWTASAESYCGSLRSLRHGWDIIDAGDPYDPGWEVPAGLAAANWHAAERAFDSGLHTFTLRVEDDNGATRVFTWYLRVIPFVDPMYQLPLMVLDQVVDRNVSSWPSRDNRPLNDQIYRNAYWHFLAEGYGGVADLNWSRDWRDHTASVAYEDIVAYRAVLCYAKADAVQTLFSGFRPSGAVDKYVWLAPYQQQGGNFMLVGAASQASFLEIAANYMVPVVFDTNEERMIIGPNEYRTGFGTRDLADGITVLRGPLMYPYATAGIAALDWTSPTGRYVYGRTTPGNQDRRAVCGGLKGLVLSPEFRARHGVSAAAIADTIYTDPEIDWRDAAADQVDTLSLLDVQAYVFSDDEFIDGNINGRPTPIVPRTCDHPDYGNVPDGMCVEPMFTGIARLDWMREKQHERGRTDWPQSRYTAAELEVGCGAMILTDHESRPQSSALTNGQVFGYLSYVSVPNKPSFRADVYWGFDPYRFDHARMRDAVRWALEYFGLTINR